MNHHLLFKKTGPTKVVTEDLDDDGPTDILASLPQGDESVYVLINQGTGKFDWQKLLQLPPNYGSVTLEYLDRDHDGNKNIVHVSGDNADYEAILKSRFDFRDFRKLCIKKGIFANICFYKLNGMATRTSVSIKIYMMSVMP